MADETMCCWCTSAEGLLRAMLPYAIRSFNDDLDAAQKLFADRFIVDVGGALQPFHEGETVPGQEQNAARRIAAGIPTQAEVDKLIDELGAIVVTRALLRLRDLIQRLTCATDSADDDAPLC